jgi:GNAT superfamily N-acetyltransferase
MKVLKQIGDIVFRRATSADVDDIVRLLANDTLGQQREAYCHPLPEYYLSAFQNIDKDENNELIVASSTNDGVIGTLHLTYLPSMTFQGSWRAQIEAVRVDERYRGHLVGQELFEWAIEHSKQRGCKILQLTCNNARTDAHRFYERLGFINSHIGFKMNL